MNYAITLPAIITGSVTTTEVACDLTGVEAKWQATTGQGTWTGLLPHFDLTVARAFTSPSPQHAEFSQQLQKRGMLTLRGQLDLWQMLRATSQPDSKLDFEYPPETVTVVFKGSGALTSTSWSTKVKRANANEVQLTGRPKTDEWLPVEISLKTGGGAPQLDVSWHTAEDPRPRALQLRRIYWEFR